MEEVPVVERQDGELSLTFVEDWQPEEIEEKELTEIDIIHIVDHTVTEHFLHNEAIKFLKASGTGSSRVYEIYANTKEDAMNFANYCAEQWKLMNVKKTIHVLVISPEDRELALYTITKDYL